MSQSPAFIAHLLPTIRGPARPPPLPPDPRWRATAATKTHTAPDAGLISRPGPTGTACTNLWPLPILGGYSWFLNVYKRRLAADLGSFSVHAAPDGAALTLAFTPGDRPSTSDAGPTHKAFRGIVTGNFNVAGALRSLAAQSEGYTLKFFERGATEPFFRRRNEVHVPSTLDDLAPQSLIPPVWQDPAPTYVVESRTSAYEVRALFSGAGSAARRPSQFEYFGMNLFPIFPFADYSCFVCVWRQHARTCPVAIDKVGGTMRLSFFDPLQLREGKQDSEMHSVAKFAVKSFLGVVTDSVVAAQHKVLIAAIAASSATRAVSNTNFRLVVDNTPRTIASKRKNEIWVEVA